MLADERHVLDELEEVEDVLGNFGLDNLGLDNFEEGVIIEDELFWVLWVLLVVVVVISRQYPYTVEHSEPSGQPKYPSVFPQLRGLNLRDK